jgi:hypothetical protein
MPSFKDMKSWRDRLGHSGLRSFTDSEGHPWVEQNAAKASKWAKLARQGHEVAWEFEKPGGGYTGRMLIDGEIYTASEATKRFLQQKR